MAKLRSVLWWLAFACAGIVAELYAPRLDALAAGLLVMLEEKDYKTLVWFLPLAVLLQEGMGTTYFGATVALYAVFLACYFLLSVLHSASKFIFICALSLALGAARILLWRLFAVLQGFPDDPAEAMRIGCMQACYLPCAWLLLSSLRRPRQRHDDRQEED